MMQSMENLVANELLWVREQGEEATHVLGMVHRLVDHGAQEYGVQQTCERLARILVEESGFHRCSILLWDLRQEELVVKATCSLAEVMGLKEKPYDEERDQGPCPSNRELLKQVFHTKEALFIEDARRSPLFEPDGKQAESGAWIVLPVHNLGVICLNDSMPRSFLSRQQNHWIMVAKVAGQCLMPAFLGDCLGDANQCLQHEINLKTEALRHKNQELMTANRTLEELIDQVPEGVCLLDTQGAIRRINRSMEALAEVSFAQVAGSSPGVFFKDPGIFSDMLQDVNRIGQCRHTDISLLDCTGRMHPVDVFLSRLTDDDGQPTGYFLVLYDMTEKKAYTEQLLWTEKLAALGTMAGGVAHEFNNLLMTVLGHTQLLLLQNIDDQMRQRLQSIEASVQRGADTLRRLQTFSGQGHESQDRVRMVDINEIIQEVVELTAPRWKNGLEKLGYTLDLQIDLDTRCSVITHASELREILINLVLNAVDAMPCGGMLRLGSRCCGNEVVIEVADTGIGMSEKVQRKIFDPFYTTKGVGNSGLGLSACWDLVHRNGGRIEVASEPGEGSLFRVTLPRATVGQESVAPHSSEIRCATYRLLLVDDDQDILKLLQDMIRLIGYKVTSTHDGHEALRLIETQTFDLVLTDLGIPEVSGWEIAGRVKAVSPATPVIAVTGWGAQLESSDWSRQGIDLVLPKPLNYDQLQSTLRQLLSSKSMCPCQAVEK